MQARRTPDEHLAIALLFALLFALGLVSSAHAIRSPYSRPVASTPSHQACAGQPPLTALSCLDRDCAPAVSRSAKSNLPTRRFTRRHFAQNTPPPSVAPFEAILLHPAPKPYNLRLPPSPALPNSSVPVALRQRAP